MRNSTKIIATTSAVDRYICFQSSHPIMLSTTWRQHLSLPETDIYLPLWRFPIGSDERENWQVEIKIRYRRSLELGIYTN